MAAQKSKIKVVQEEQIPKESNVSRKLNFDDTGEPIKHETSPVMHRP